MKEFHGDRKSISKERTFVKDTNNFYLILSELNKINEQINIEVKKRNIFYRTIIGGSYDLTEEALTIKRKSKKCSTIEIPGHASSQFVSALLMVCPLLICKKNDPLISYPYKNITYIYIKTLMRLPL